MKKLLPFFLSLLAALLYAGAPFVAYASTEVITFSTTEPNINNMFGSGQHFWGEQFTPVAGVTVTAANPSVDMYRNGNSVGNINFIIYTDSGGIPGTSLATGTVAMSALSPASTCAAASPGAITVSLTGGTPYWLVLHRDNPNTDATSYISGCTDQTKGDHTHQRWNNSELPGTWFDPNVTQLKGSITLTETANAPSFNFWQLLPL